MAINRELSQFGRLVEITDGEHVGIGTTSNVIIGFGTITATTITATTFIGDGSGLTSVGGGTTDYNELINKPTIPSDTSDLTNSAGYITGYTVTQSDVTQHQAALSITESQISDFGTYATQSYVGLATAGLASQTYVDTKVGLATAGLSGSSESVGVGTTNVSTESLIVSGITTLNSATIIGNLNVSGTVFATDFDVVVGGGAYQGVPGVVTSIIAGDNIIISNSSGEVTISSGIVGISTTSTAFFNNVNASGIITATSFVKSGGTSSQFLKADGSVDSSTYATQSYVGLATAGLASQSYVGLATAGLASQSYVGLATVGLLNATGSGANLTGIVTSIAAGSGISIDQSTGTVTITATGGGGGGVSNSLAIAYSIALS